MSDYSFLKPGLWWARHKISNNWSRWAIIEISGEFPFMTGDVVFEPCGEDPKIFHPCLNIDIWQFGPKLEIPSANYIEVKEAKDVT